QGQHAERRQAAAGNHTVVHLHHVNDRNELQQVHCRAEDPGVNEVLFDGLEGRGQLRGRWLVNNIFHVAGEVGPVPWPELLGGCPRVSPSWGCTSRISTALPCERAIVTHAACDLIVITALSFLPQAPSARGGQE